MTNEPTYSVFVRFRKAQRLTLKRAVPLDVALRFANQVRGERFHNHDDVFIVDDASGEAISEPCLTTDRVLEAIPEAPPSEVPSSQRVEKSGVEDLLSYRGKRQLRHTQITLRGGLRLTSTVTRSLGQLDRLMECLVAAKLPGGEAEHLVSETRAALEQVQKVHEALYQLASKFSAQGGDEMGEPSEASLGVGTKMLLVSGAGAK